MWIPTLVDGEPVATPIPGIWFWDEGVSSDDRCFSFPLEISGDHMTHGEGGFMQPEACDGYDTQQGKVLTSALGGSTWRVDGGTLSLRSSKGEVFLRSSGPPPAIEGAWTATQIDGKAASQPATNVTFGEDGKLDISGPCAQLSGFSYAEDVGKIATTGLNMYPSGVFCDRDLLIQDGDVIQTVTDRPTFSVEGASLVLSTDARTVTFERTQVASPTAQAGSALPYLPVLEHAPGDGIAGVGFGGTLEVHNGCVVLVPKRSGSTPGSAKSWLLIFDVGYHLVRASDGSIAIANGDGRYLWRVGDPFTTQLGGTPVGGKYWPSAAEALGSLAEPVPKTCTYDRILGTNAQIYRSADGPDEQLPVAVPSLIGLTRTVAESKATEFRVLIWEESPKTGTVRVQKPRPGAMAYPGTPIVIRLTQG